MLAYAEARELGPFVLADPKGTSTDAQRVGVMEDDQLVVSREPQVALDAGAQLERGLECAQCVFGNGWTTMQPAMREPARAGIQRIRP